MQRLTVPASAVAAVALATALLLALRATSRSSAPSRGAEVARLRAHFDSVQRELLDRDLSALTAEQRARRLRLLRALDAYRERGVFPRNHDAPGRRVSYFVDARGTPSAMAYLMVTAGRRDLVERIAAERNEVTIHQLAADAALRAWLDSTGLTLDEAARIQPAYDWLPTTAATAPRDAGATP